MSHNSDFFLRILSSHVAILFLFLLQNKKIIKRYLFIFLSQCWICCLLQIWEFVSHNSEYISCNIYLFSQNFEKSLVCENKNTFSFFFYLMEISFHMLICIMVKSHLSQDVENCDLTTACQINEWQIVSLMSINTGNVILYACVYRCVCVEVDVSGSEDCRMFLPQMRWQTAHNYVVLSLESLEQPETDRNTL